MKHNSVRSDNGTSNLCNLAFQKNWHTVKTHKSNKYAYNQQLSFPYSQILRINILSLLHSYVNSTQITKINTHQMHGA